MLEFLQNKASLIKEKLQMHNENLAEVFYNCFLNTIETTVKILEDQSVFVLTGDIPAMWLRDSTWQVLPYIMFSTQCPELENVLEKITAKQAFYVNIDPYANAFNAEPDGDGAKDITKLNPWVWERKYEIDSLCSPIYLAYTLWKVNKQTKIFTKEYYSMLRKIISILEIEQDHSTSYYSFVRLNCVKTDTLVNNGRGRPVNQTGMSWSGFRPSDDCCDFGYLVPSNMMAVVALRYAADILEKAYNDKKLKDKSLQLAMEIEDGIELYGKYLHYKYGLIYSYETDGFGNYNLMDDANIPSLLSIPFLGYKSVNDEVYQNTRKFILSSDNPYYYVGKYARGIGSPHTAKGYIWHMSLIIQALTSCDDEEISHCLSILLNTNADTGLMHESFSSDDPCKYTRPWFGWANSLFATLIIHLLKDGYFDRAACRNIRGKGV